MNRIIMIFYSCCALGCSTQNVQHSIPDGITDLNITENPLSYCLNNSWVELNADDWNEVYYERGSLCGVWVIKTISGQKFTVAVSEEMVHVESNDGVYMSIVMKNRSRNAALKMHELYSNHISAKTKWQ